MSGFRLAPAAQQDYFAIVDYFSDEKPDAAMDVLLAFEDAFRLIASRPGVGHYRDDIADEALRIWTVFSYLIVYRPEERPVEIVRILHGARDIVSALDADL